MRGVQIFSGTSHPALTAAICERLGTAPAKCELRKFANGETNVSINVSVRNQDVFVVQSGSSRINDSIMELLIIINACKGGSARSITAVMPYFPYSRQSKKKSHRGAITARMLANLLSVAGVDHVITVDLHASQMQGFFGKPVDNLFAEPLIARWIRVNVSGWREAVVVTKNAGGSKRVTSLADALKVNFGIVTTDRRRDTRANGLTESTIFFDSVDAGLENTRMEKPHLTENEPDHPQSTVASPTNLPLRIVQLAETIAAPDDAVSDADSPFLASGLQTPYTARRPSENVDQCTDERAREVITARLVQGHLVDDDYQSPIPSSAASVTAALVDGEVDGVDPMTASTVFEPEHALGGSFDAGNDSDDDDDKLRTSTEERTITLVGDVKDKTVFIVDDMIDKAGSWIAAAETVVKRGGAKKVYCIATHGLFGGDALEQMEACQCIDHVVVTNSFPIPLERARRSSKLVILDLSALLSEAIRRHHYGESISSLFVAHE